MARSFLRSAGLEAALLTPRAGLGQNVPQRIPPLRRPRPTLENAGVRLGAMALPHSGLFKRQPVEFFQTVIRLARLPIRLVGSAARELGVVVP
jgi:hypothetical protein